LRLAVPVALFVTALVIAQDAKKTDPPKYTPTPAQLTSLQYKQHVTVYASQSLQAEVQKLPQWTDMQKANADLMAECAAIVKENKWPEGVTCDPNVLTFHDPVKPEASEKKPESAKKP